MNVKGESNIANVTIIEEVPPNTTTTTTPTATSPESTTEQNGETGEIPEKMNVDKVGIPNGAFYQQGNSVILTQLIRIQR